MSSLSRRLIELSTAMLVISACTTGQAVPTIEARVTPTSGIDGATTPTADPVVVDTPLTVPTNKPADVIHGFGGPLNVEQEKYLETNVDYLNRKAKLKSDFNFVSATNCLNRQFNADSVEISEKPIWDKDNKTAAPAIEVRYPDGWRIFTANKANFETPSFVGEPDLKKGYYIGQNEAMVELSADTYWDDNLKAFVKLDTYGDVIQMVNHDGYLETKYPINILKMKQIPDSLENLKNNLNKYTTAPDLFTPEGQEWLKNLEELLGPPINLPLSFIVNGEAVYDNNTTWTLVTMPQNRTPLNTNNTMFFHFNHNGIEYPVAMLVYGPPTGGVYGGIIAILSPESIQLSDGPSLLSNLSDGMKIEKVMCPVQESGPWPSTIAQEYVKNGFGCTTDANGWKKGLVWIRTQKK